MTGDRSDGLGVPRDALVLVRHGRTAWNVERRFLGRSDVPLDDEGLLQAQALGRWGKDRFSTVFSSPLSRALETARALRDDPLIHDDLVEQHQGVLEGKLGPEVIPHHAEFFGQFQVDPENTLIPGGESMGQCRDRALAFIDTVVRGHLADGPVAIVSHQMVLSSLLAAFSGAPLSEWRRFALPNGSVTVLRPSGGGFVVEHLGWQPPAGTP